MKALNLKLEHYALLVGGLVFFLCLALFVFFKNYFFLGIPFVCVFLGWGFLNLKSFYWFFLFSIPLSATIYFFNQSLSTTVPDEPLMWMFLGITVLFLAYNHKIFPAWYFRSPLMLILCLQILWMLVSLVFSQDFLLSLKYTLSRFWFLNVYLILPVLIFKEKKDFKTAFLLFVIPTTLHALVAFTWHYFLSFGYWQSNKVVRPFYENHVDYSTILSMIFPLLLIAFQLSKGKKFFRWILGLTILFYIPAIFAASARAAILAVGFALIIAFLIKKKKVQFVMPAIFVIIALSISLLVQNNKFIDFRPDKSTATQETLMDAITGAFTGKDMSSMERFYRWIAAVRMSKDHPFVGVGPNNFYDNYKPYTIQIFATWVSRNPERSTTHNYFLLMLVEQGWPAMLLYAILLMAVFSRAQKIYHRTNDPFYKKITMGLIMMFAAGFVNNFFSELLETHKVGALFYLSIALLIIVDHITLKEENERKLNEINKPAL